MREIKFRGMNLCGEWVYGDLRHDRMCMPDGKLQKYISVCGEPIHPKSVGQFTGLKDCEGREIYEGDIVRFELPPMVLTNEKTTVGAVVYEYGQFLVIIHAMRFTIFSVINDCTVIGNIHDNPELLEAHA